MMRENHLGHQASRRESPTSGAMTAHSEIQNSDVSDDGIAHLVLQPRQVCRARRLVPILVQSPHGGMRRAPWYVPGSDRELYDRGVATLLASWEEYARGSSGAALVQLDGATAAVFTEQPERAVYNNARWTAASTARARRLSTG